MFINSYYYIDDFSWIFFIFTCVNSRQARNTHRSDHQLLCLCFYCLPRIPACACAIKSKRTATSHLYISKIN